MSLLRVCYPAIFHPEEVGYSVSVPDFDSAGYGCFTQGDTLEEASDMAFDAIGLCIEDIMENNKELPVASKPECIEKDAHDFVVPIAFDMEKYLKQTKANSVKKTLTIPEWLNDLATKQNINFSRVLQVALKQQLGIE